MTLRSGPEPLSIHAMKTSFALGSALAVLLVSGVSSAAVTTYKATLNGAHETPPVTTAATGTATLTFNDETTGANARRLEGTVTYTGLTPSAQHIHKAACGASGDPENISLIAPAGTPFTFRINKNLTAAEATALVAGEYYVNIHTMANGRGEIRGQLYLDGSGTTCPAGGVDAGTDAGSSGSSGSSGTSGTSGASGTSGTSGGNTSGGTSGTSGTSGASGDAGTSGSARPGSNTKDDGGCSTSGTESNGAGLALGGLAGLALALILRSRKPKKS